MGVLLMLLPLIVSRLAVILCGIVVLLIGIGMVIDLTMWNKFTGSSGDDSIIDER